MPFLALVYVKDAPTANRLIKNWDATGYADQNYKIVGMFRMPNARDVQTCSGYCKAGGAYTRHHPGGFLVHACGRRHRSWRKRIMSALFDTLGVNLMRRSETPALFQNPATYGKE
jgi:hypothetical protein